MKKMRVSNFAVLFLIIFFVSSCSVQSSETDLPLDRTTDWSGAGVWVGGVRGIPDYPVGVTCEPPTYNVYPNQASDSRAGIQAAINACPAGRAVYLPAGTYRLGGSINMKSGVSLRGAGPGVTILQATTSGVSFSANAVDGGAATLISDPGPGPDPANRSGPIVSGYGKGSSTVTVSSALSANLDAGHVVLINQLNDPLFVNRYGTESSCPWAGGGGERALGETKMIASKSGTSITFTRPLHHDYKSKLRPKLIRMSSSPIREAGIENLTFNGGGYSASRVVLFSGAAYCWVRSVEITNFPGFAVQLWWGALGCEVTNCYIHDASAAGSSNGYATVIQGNATDNYIYNSISKWVKVHTAIGSAGGTANVVAYNYCHSTFHWAPHWALPAYATHGAHTLMNLFEGNYGPQVQLDAIHGSGSHNTFFRNALTGIWNNPSVTSNMICASIASLNYYISFIGNVLGHSGMRGAYETDPYADQNIINIWRRGTDGLTRSSLIRHGNYDYITNSTIWDSSIEERIIQPSLYLSYKPAWFGSLDWPAIGPDVTGYMKNTPAKLRWDSYLSSGNLADLFVK